MYIVTTNTTLNVGLHWAKFNKLHEELAQLEKQKLIINLKMADLKHEVDAEAKKALRLENQSDQSQNLAS